MCHSDDFTTNIIVQSVNAVCINEAVTDPATCSDSFCYVAYNLEQSKIQDAILCDILGCRTVTITSATLLSDSVNTSKAHRPPIYIILKIQCLTAKSHQTWQRATSTLPSSTKLHENVCTDHQAEGTSIKSFKMEVFHFYPKKPIQPLTMTFYRTASSRKFLDDS
jgi:hypothetical protein